VPQWLVVSLVLSILLTVVVNAVLWLFPRIGPWLELKFRDMTANAQRRADDPTDGHVRVFFPWKFMLVASLVLTVVLNLVVRLW